MKVLHIHQYFATPRAATGTRSYELSLAMKAAGHEVTMLASTAQLRPDEIPPGRGMIRRGQIAGFNVIVLDVPYQQRMSYARRILSFLQFMFGPIETGGLDTVADYFGVLEEQGIAINTAYYVPHGIVRMHAMGSESREPTDDEMESMKALVRRGMEDGAIGMSTGLIYPPGMFAKTDELIELTKVVA